MIQGVLCALGAGSLWGLVFITPILLPQYSGLMLSVGRYLAFGFIALLIAWPNRQAIQALEKADWLEAAKLSLIGNLIYYGTLAAAIQLADPPLPTMIIGALPVVIAITANLQEGHIPWRRLIAPLCIIALGIAAVNHEELARLQASGAMDPKKHLSGALLALIAMVCWTWYPIRNSRWLQKRKGLTSSTWATAQGLTTLPLAIIGYIALVTLETLKNPAASIQSLVLGPEPARYIALMFTLGLLASWLGTLLWNKASQLLPTSLAGQLIVFETIAALCYAYAWRQTLPGWLSLTGIVLLIIGVMLGVGLFKSVEEGETSKTDSRQR